MEADGVEQVYQYVDVSPNLHGEDPVQSRDNSCKLSHLEKGPTIKVKGTASIQYQYLRRCGL